MITNFDEKFISVLQHRKGYFSTPYNSRLDKPIISFLICWRIKRELYKGNDIYDFFDSVMHYVDPSHLNKMEFLVKMDLDDNMSLNEVFVKRMFIEKYPKLIIRPYVYRRWEARSSLYLNYAFLFSQRNPNSIYITFATDDSLLERSIIPDLLFHSTQKMESKYSILSAHGHSPALLEACENYRQLTNDRYLWSGAGLTDPFPIISAKIIEICGNMGYQSNIDNWITLLGVIMFIKHKIRLQKDMHPWIEFNLKKVEPINTQDYPYNFNNDMIISTSKKCENDYYFDLIEQQVQSVYLNMKADGVHFPYEK